MNKKLIIFGIGITGLALLIFSTNFFGLIGAGIVGWYMSKGMSYMEENGWR